MRRPLLSLASGVYRPPPLLTTTPRRPHLRLPTRNTSRSRRPACGPRPQTPAANTVQPAYPRPDVKARPRVEGRTDRLPAVLVAACALAARRQNRRGPRRVIRRQVMRVEEAVKHTPPTRRCGETAPTLRPLKSPAQTANSRRTSDLDPCSPQPCASAPYTAGRRMECQTTPRGVIVLLPRTAIL